MSLSVTVILKVGYFGSESFEKPNWYKCDESVKSELLNGE